MRQAPEQRPHRHAARPRIFRELISRRDMIPAEQPPCRAAAQHGSHMIESLISDNQFGFTGLISIINPIGFAFDFLDRTA
jgi:hypothetical protein